MQRLLYESALRRRSAELMRQWSALGVSVTRVSHEQHWALKSRMRGGRSLQPLRPLMDIKTEVRSFAGGRDLVSIMGWSTIADPVLLVPMHQLLRHLSQMEVIYRDGFIVFNEPASKALHIDYDEADGTQCQVIVLSASGA
ncbi:hypothetical protein [Methylorubrum aminovorans]|uniref:hypothetical protein n=1 Tax=Methylorubrum aminovorans TaxID=269069 RepID=UPI001EDCB58D|nr:hypothetical protein [Methylorubrum aminovorans]